MKTYLYSKKTRVVVTAVCASLISVVCLVAAVSYFRLLPASGASKAQLARTQSLKVAKVVKGHPVGLTIPSLGMNLTVIDGHYNKSNGIWTLTLDKAQYVTFTPPANNHGGDTFIYGHYRPEVFARLHLITPGATATVITSNHYRFNYVFTDTYAVKPSDSSVFSYKGAPMLTLQTCSGSFFQNRQMYEFQFKDYQKV